MCHHTFFTTFSIFDCHPCMSLRSPLTFSHFLSFSVIIMCHCQVWRLRQRCHQDLAGQRTFFWPTAGHIRCEWHALISMMLWRDNPFTFIDPTSVICIISYVLMTTHPGVLGGQAPLLGSYPARHHPLQGAPAVRAAAERGAAAAAHPSRPERGGDTGAALQVRRSEGS